MILAGIVLTLGLQVARADCPPDRIDSMPLCCRFLWEDDNADHDEHEQCCSR